MLVDWSARFDHLREVTRHDIRAVARTLSGSKRHHVVSVLRSLFRHCKTTGTIFRDPAARIRVGRHDYGVIVLLQPSEISDAPAATLSPAGDWVVGACTGLA